MFSNCVGQADRDYYEDICGTDNGDSQFSLDSVSRVNSGMEDNL